MFSLDCERGMILKRFKSNNDALIKMFFMVGFFMMAFACFVLYAFFLERYAVLFVLSIAFTALYTYSFVSYFYNQNTEKNINDLTKAIQNIFCEDCNHAITVDKNFSDAFNALAIVKSTLAQRETKEAEIRNIIISAANCLSLDDMLADILPRLNSSTGSVCSAFYLMNEDSGKLELRYSIGFSKNIYDKFDMIKGEGLMGVAASQNEITVIDNIPDDTKYIMLTVLGNIKPKSIVVVPVMSHGASVGIFVFAGMQSYYEERLGFLSDIKDYLGVLLACSMRCDSETKY